MKKGDLRYYRRILRSIDSCSNLLPPHQRIPILFKTLEIAQSTKKKPLILLTKSYSCQLKVQSGYDAEEILQEL
ncbi:MAG: hypothetical protein AAFU64_08235, partial [Bacteroidota bacterium]